MVSRQEGYVRRDHIQRSVHMGKYDNLTKREKQFLQRLFEHHQKHGTSVWRLLPPDHSGTELMALDNSTSGVTGVPSQEAFYQGLEEKGFIVANYTKSGSIQFSLQKPLLEYGEYEAKSRFLRWWDDISHTLVEENTVGSKMFWAVFGYVLGFVSGILLKLALG